VSTFLITNADVPGGPGPADVRLGPRVIEEIGRGLARQAREPVLDAAGGAVIAGLHDHHLHLRAAVAARSSADVSGAAGPAAFDRMVRTAVGKLPTGRWLRAVGWDEEAAGPLDRRRLDALTGPVPARVQHRSGVMWVLNTAALHAVGASRGQLAGPEPAGLERAADGELSGRLLRMDDWLRERLPATAAGDFPRGLAELAAWSARRGITGFTDATPGRDQADVKEFSRLSAAGTFPQRLVLMAPPGLREPVGPRVALGPLKIVLDDSALPGAGELAARIDDSRRRGRGAAIHCVTADQLVIAVAAFEQCAPVPAGGRLAGRIEHAGVVPPGYAERLSRLGVAVVTQPGFIAGRGDSYLRRVPAAEQGWLYPCASLAAAGVTVAASTDAPFGPADPWQCMVAAVSRRSRGGVVIGETERTGADRALEMFQTRARDVRRLRTVRAGQPSDVCVLHLPLDRALLKPEAETVRTTIVCGQPVAGDGSS
jgi:predicted amidohydrolase YtcJ